MSEEPESCPVCGALPIDQVDSEAVRELVRNRYKLSRQELLDDCVSPASPTTEGRGDLTLRQAAERLIELGSKIDRASTEDEENRLCDERDKLLSMMRKADAFLSPPSGDGKQEQARPSDSAPISTLSKDTTK